MFVDNNDRFWSASVDDQEVSITQTNTLYKGLWLPAGRSSITWKYDPWVIRYLRYSALVALILLGTAIVISGWEYERRNDQD